MDNKIIDIDRLSRYHENINTLLTTKQESLVSGDNIKTINGESILGSGNITIGGSDVYVTDFCIDDFHKIISEIEDSIHIDAEGIINAVNESKIISIPINRENSRGGYIAHVEDYEDYINFYVNYDVYSISFWIDKIEVTNELNSENVTFTVFQSCLVSGESIKTINGEEILGSGDFELATKDELNAKADDSSVVHKEGDEIIYGTKKFAHVINASNGVLVWNLASINSYNEVTGLEENVIGYIRQTCIVNNENYPLYLYGSVARPKYNDFEDIAFLSDVNGKQDALISGTNIKTINGESILGSGNIESLASKEYVDEAIAGIVDGAPETLDTLNELSAALKDNADIVDVLNQSISSKQDTITDLETIRQGAAKGATALQSYTEQYKGTVTGVKINGATKNPSSGVVDLGYINKQLSTSTSSSMTLSPNIYYRNTSTSLSTLTITLGSVSNSNIINEYFVEFTTRSAGTTVSLPSTIKWANGETPTFEASTTYQISIVNNLGTVQKFK